jgi:glycosyltransferase involved in cell wall biosynthesis
MKVLFITNHYLDSNGGGSFASRAYANAFGEIAETCVLLYPDRGKDISPFIHEKYILKGISNGNSKIRKLFDIYRGRIHRFYKVIPAEVKEFQPDLVVFDNSRCSAGLIQHINLLGIKVIVVHHNYEMEYHRGEPPNIFWRIPFMHYVKKAEMNAVQKSDLNLTLTMQDANLLRMNYDVNNQAKFELIGCFESRKKKDLTFYKDTAKNNKNICIAITGTLSDLQTEDSLIPFLNSYYPLLLKIIPNSILIIAGKDPSNKIINICSKYTSSIKLIPNPDDIEEITKQADIYLCPICIGGGLKLRIMDGLKAGLPILTHKISGRGYEEFQNAGFMITYDDSESFEKGLIKLLWDIEEGVMPKRRIQNFFDSKFSFNSGVEKLRKILIRNFNFY